MLRKDTRQIKEIREEWESRNVSGKGKQKETECGKQQLCHFWKQDCRAEKEQSVVLFSSPTMLCPFIIIAYCHSWCAFHFCGCSVVCGFSITPVSTPCSPLTFLTSQDIFGLSNSRFLLCCVCDPLLILYAVTPKMTRLLMKYIVWLLYVWQFLHICACQLFLFFWLLLHCFVSSAICE